MNSPTYVKTNIGGKEWKVKTSHHQNKYIHFVVCGRKTLSSSISLCHPKNITSLEHPRQSYVSSTKQRSRAVCHAKSSLLHCNESKTKKKSWERKGHIVHQVHKRVQTVHMQKRGIDDWRIRAQSEYNAPFFSLSPFFVPSRNCPLPAIWQAEKNSFSDFRFYCISLSNPLPFKYIYSGKETALASRR